ncbi:MAG TPA: alpha/beta hydrolase domain-containing protein [Acidimicrobiia bacterium]|nr:alpha/beta hydrolase domain-containing protein [Acidimicrobiia bacterium]
MQVRTGVRGFTFVVTACACSMTLMLSGVSAGASAANPSVTPATGGGGKPVVPGFTAFDPAVVGYKQSEVFLSGTASAYEPTAPLGTDGKYGVAATSSAPYTTRAVVMRPIDPKRFNGTVVVEWLNVSGGVDAGPDWILAHNEMVREGFAWVGVSAQKGGVDALKSSDPQRGDAVRYAGLSHPGDSFSYDIFSQAGQAVHDNPGGILGGLAPRHLIGAGESQSAGRLVTYIDAVHPLVHVYDGFLVHSRGAGGAALSQAPQPSVPVPTPAPIRGDVGVPVLVFQTETDVFNSNLNARQPDTDTYRLWEVAGTSHFDFYGLSIGTTDVGDGQGAVAVLASMQNPTNQPNPNFTCSSPINTGPAHFVLDAAFSSLNRWVADHAVPPVAPRLQTTGVSPVVFATDANGNVVGGIRTPAVDAPVAKLSGLPQGGSQFCFLFGTTVPFTPSQLAALYKNHGQFVSASAQAAKSAHKAGFLVDADAKEIQSAAVHSGIGK